MNRTATGMIAAGILSIVLLHARQSSAREDPMAERLERAFAEHLELTEQTFRESVNQSRERFGAIMRRLPEEDRNREDLLHEARAIFERLEQMRGMMTEARREHRPEGPGALQAQMEQLEREYHQHRERAEQEHRRNMERTEQEFRRRMEELRRGAQQREREEHKMREREQGDREHPEARARAEARERERDQPEARERERERDRDREHAKEREGERDREGDERRLRDREHVTEREAHEAAEREREQRRDRE